MNKAKVYKAYLEYKDRQNRSSNPDGTFDKAGRFYLSETCECCSGIRSPSRSFPYSQMVHGRTGKHVANLFELDAIEKKLFNRIVKNPGVLAEEMTEVLI